MKQIVTKVFSYLVFFFVVLVLLPISVGRTDNAAGKKIFLDSKCNKCHSFKSQGIQQLPKSADAEAEDADEGEKIDPPDLSTLDDAFVKAGLDKFLKKQVAVEYKGKSRKHKKSFTGSDADLKTLIDFLQGK